MVDIRQDEIRRKGRERQLKAATLPGALIVGIRPAPLDKKGRAAVRTSIFHGITPFL